MKKESSSIITVKTLLAVVIFTGLGTIIIGGGYLIGGHYKNVTENRITKSIVKEVTITTDKTEYEKGEEINIVVKNNKQDKIFHCGAGDLSGWRWNLKKKENENWKELDGKELFQTVWTPPIREVAPNETFSVAGKKEVIEKPINSGIYKIGFKFFLTLDKNLENIRENCWERESNIIYSNEFIIKEKVKDETADWQTYRNEEYGFEVQYPELLNEPEEEIVNNPYFFKTSFYIPCYTPINEIPNEEKEGQSSEFIKEIGGMEKYESGARFLKIGVAENPFNLPIKKWFKDYLKIRYEGLEDYMPAEKEYQSEEIVFADIKGEKIYLKALPPRAGACRTIYLPKDLKIYSIEDCQYEAFLYPATCYGIEEILFTFKFIEN